MADRIDGLALFHAHQYIHRGVTYQLDRDLVNRIGRSGPGGRALTPSQAVEYQIIRDQDVAMSAYLEDSSGPQDPA